MRIIQVDFNSRDEQDRVWLTLPCSLEDIVRLDPPLCVGELVSLTDGEGFVEGVTVLEEGNWLASVNWETWTEDYIVDLPAEIGSNSPRRGLKSLLKDP